MAAGRLTRALAVTNTAVHTSKSLGNRASRATRLAALSQPHIAPLSALVSDLREMMKDPSIPYFDPYDGGVAAECLFLLEAPGRKAIESRFVSRDNPDETAKKFLLLNSEAGIDRRRTVIWNIVPWYVGTGTNIRPVNTRDILAAEPALRSLIMLLPSLHTIVLVGAKAARAGRVIAALAPTARLSTMPHPSPMFVNRAAGNRALILTALQDVARTLSLGRSAG